MLTEMTLKLSTGGSLPFKTKPEIVLDLSDFLFVFCCRVFEYAAQYRNQFKEDVLIDLVCFRRHGHNELDQPLFTQPKMYSSIQKHPSTVELYRKKLIEAGLVSEEEVENMKDYVWRTLSEKFEASKDYPSDQSEWLSSRWSGFFSPQQRSIVRETGVPKEELSTVGDAIAHVPDSVKIVSSGAINCLFCSVSGICKHCGF